MKFSNCNQIYEATDDVVGVSWVDDEHILVTKEYGAELCRVSVFELRVFLSLPNDLTYIPLCSNLTGH